MQVTLYIVYLLREIPVEAKCCPYIAVSNKHGNKTCILSVHVRHVSLFMLI